MPGNPCRCVISLYSAHCLQMTGTNTSISLIRELVGTDRSWYFWTRVSSATHCPDPIPHRMYASPEGSPWYGPHLCHFPLVVPLKASLFRLEWSLPCVLHGHSIPTIWGTYSPFFLALSYFTLRVVRIKRLPNQSLCDSKTVFPLGLHATISATSSPLKLSTTKWPPAMLGCISVWGLGSVLPEGRSLWLQQIGITPISNIVFDESRCQQILPM